MAKRGIDIVGGVIGLVPFCIAYGILYIPYKVGSNKGPIIFKQSRIGENGELFNIYKFRSMRVNADEILKADEKLHQKYITNGYKLEQSEDPRITRLGRFIRKTSIDELPQFINVIKGEMSLVGPRPIVTEELEEYRNEDKVAEFLSMKPGITGVWQTAGRSNVGYPDRVFLEISYAKKDSILFDLKILAKTVFKVFMKEGAY
ncbi:sugar transferase [Enterococcus faecium]|nr:sugar transferase [Enterococcus faecium]EME8175982.1 sugar transferase [Enterococcus faecium]EME8228762.1 sugar transferase [Enterococcus faecium]EMF0416485.1 sugar transferase [Enterococcus faecium]MBW8081811.1 sugar transferase [Enterococcus faecium]